MVMAHAKPKGFIAIVSLLIITTIAMFFAMSMLKDGVENAALSLSSIYYEDARANAITCLEDTLLRLKREQAFERPVTYNLDDRESCSTSLQWFAPQQIRPGLTQRLVDLRVMGASHDFQRTFDYGLRVNRFDVNHPDRPLDYLNTIDILSLNESDS